MRKLLGKDARLFSAPMHSNSTIIACGCGAAYTRREVRLPIKDIGLFECHDCGARLECWSGRVVPLFERIRMPEARRA